MDSPITASLYLLWAGTMALNILIAGVQYSADRDRSNFFVLIYWLTLVTAAMVNLYFPDRSLALPFASSLMTFLNQCVLGVLFSKVRRLEVGLRFPLMLYGAIACTATALYALGFDFVFYGTVFKAASPITWFYFVYQAMKGPGQRLTTVQCMFVGVASLMSLHYLDWAYFRTRHDLFIAGSMLAFGLYYVISVLLPSVLLEHSYSLKNESLEEEVKRRVKELTATRDELWNSNKLASLGRMAGGISHELNNSLSVISLHVDRLRYDAKRGPLTEADVAQQVAGVHRALRRVAIVTEALRKLARDRVRNRRTLIDVRELVQTIVGAHRDWVERAEIRLEVDFEQGEWFLECDAYEVSQALSNLLRNAIEAAEGCAQGSRWVRIRGRLGARMEISIEDSGKIAPDVAERVMEPFFTTKGQGEGMGLGVSVSRVIAEQHGGGLALDLGAPTTRFVFSMGRGGASS